MRISKTLGILAFATLSMPCLASVESTLGMVGGLHALPKASVQIDYAAELNRLQAAQPYVISSESMLRVRNEQRIEEQVDRLMTTFGMNGPALPEAGYTLPMPSPVSLSRAPALDVTAIGCSVQAPEPFWSLSDLGAGSVATTGCEAHDCVYL